MSAERCPECRNLLDQAAKAISAHATALSRMSEAVRSGSAAAINQIEAELEFIRSARELSVLKCDAHRSDHATASLIVQSA